MFELSVVVGGVSVVCMHVCVCVCVCVRVCVCSTLLHTVRFN